MMRVMLVVAWGIGTIYAFASTWNDGGPPLSACVVIGVSGLAVGALLGVP